MLIHNYHMLKFFQYIIFITLFHTVASHAESATDKAGQMAKIVEQAPEYTPEDIAIFDADNKQHFLEEYEGKTALLVFWATWCAPCVTEMADLDALQKDFRKLPFLVLPISEDYAGIDHVKSFYKINDLRHLPIMHDYKNALFKSFGIIGLPTSILVNPQGMVVAKFSGAINWYDEKVRNILLKYIPGNPGLPRNSYKDNAVNYIQSSTILEKVGDKIEDKGTAEKETKEEPTTESKDEKPAH